MHITQAGLKMSEVGFQNQCEVYASIFVLTVHLVCRFHNGLVFLRDGPHITIHHPPSLLMLG